VSNLRRLLYRFSKFLYKWQTWKRQYCWISRKTDMKKNLS